MSNTESSLTIRVATLADLAALAPIEHAADQQFVAAGHPEFGHGDTISDEAARLGIEDGRITVAEIDHAVVGWSYVSTSGAEFELVQICVDPARQRRGIGRSLLQRVIDHSRADGWPSVILDTQSDVSWNRPWYETFGFDVVPEADWTDDMQAIVVEQTEAGLDWTTRVHMRLTFRPRS